MENEATAEIATQTSLISDIAQAGLTVQFLLLALIGMSIYCWAIIFKKRKQFSQLDEDNKRFLDLFWSASALDQIHAKSDHHKDSSLARIFDRGYTELRKIKQLDTPIEQTMDYGMVNLESALRKGQDQEVNVLENRLNFLATTGSTAPFIGLLGTVVGIMNSFRDITNAGSASLTTVAPGISEALFATAVGLFAAIPAVIAYNFMLSKVSSHENNMNDFITDFLNHARLEFLRKP